MNDSEDISEKWNDIVWKRPEQFLKPGQHPMVRA